MEIIFKIREMVTEGEGDEVVELVKVAVNQGVSISAIVQDGLIEAMNVIGPKMASGEMFVPEVLMSAKAMKAGLEYLKPVMQAGDMTSQGKIVIGTVKGDLHDIGKNLVAMMLESSGFEVINIGIDQAEEEFVKMAGEHNPDIIGLSALLTTTMPAMRDTVTLLKEKNVSAKIIIGGAPVSREFAEQIGADGFASDGAGAVALAKELLA